MLPTFPVMYTLIPPKEVVLFTLDTLETMPEASFASSDFSRFFTPLKVFGISMSKPSPMPAAIILPTSSRNFVDGEWIPNADFAAASRLEARLETWLVSHPQPEEMPDHKPEMMFHPMSEKLENHPDKIEITLDISSLANPPKVEMMLPELLISYVNNSYPVSATLPISCKKPSAIAETICGIARPIETMICGRF